MKTKHSNIVFEWYNDGWAEVNRAGRGETAWGGGGGGFSVRWYSYTTYNMQKVEYILGNVILDFRFSIHRRGPGNRAPKEEQTNGVQEG